MTLYQEIEGSKRLYPAEQAIKSLRNVTELAADLPEVRIYRTTDGKWLYRSSNGDATPCVTATSDYQQIEGYAAEEETDGTAMRFLFRTAFECRFCYKKTVSLHAACIELDDFAVAFTGPSGVGKSTRALAWIHALGAKLISGDRPAVRIEKQEARPVVFHGMGKNRFSAMWKSPCGAFLKYDVRRPIIFANSAENRPKS